MLLNFRADAQYVGEFFWDIPNLGKQEAYQTVGLRMALTDVEGTWELSVRADNLFDEGYHTELLYNFAGDPDIANGNCSECHLARVGQPRTVVATFTYNF